MQIERCVGDLPEGATQQEEKRDGKMLIEKKNTEIQKRDTLAVCKRRMRRIV